MNKKLVFSTLSVLALTIAAAAPALATPPPAMGTYKWTPPAAAQAQTSTPSRAQAIGGNQAQHPCFGDLQAVQAEWNGMTMNMSSSEEGGSTAGDALRIAREDCNEGNVAGTQAYLNVVRSHLAMAQHPAPHDR